MLASTSSSAGATPPRRASTRPPRGGGLMDGGGSPPVGSHPAMGAKWRARAPGSWSWAGGGTGSSIPPRCLGAEAIRRLPWLQLRAAGPQGATTGPAAPRPPTPRLPLQQLLFLRRTLRRFAVSGETSAQEPPRRLVAGAARGGAHREGVAEHVGVAVVPDRGAAPAQDPPRAGGARELVVVPASDQERRPRRERVLHVLRDEVAARGGAVALDADRGEAQVVLGRGEAGECRATHLRVLREVERADAVEVERGTGAEAAVEELGAAGVDRDRVGREHLLDLVDGEELREGGVHAGISHGRTATAGLRRASRGPRRSSRSPCRGATGAGGGGRGRWSGTRRTGRSPGRRRRAARPRRCGRRRAGRARGRSRVAPRGRRRREGRRRGRG